MAGALLTRLTVAGGPSAWREAGFDLAGDRSVVVGTVRIDLAESGRGIAEWTLHGLASTDLDGLPTREEPDAPPPMAPAPVHPNGVLALDHVVAFSPDLDRTVAALEPAGLDLRRMREGPTSGGAWRQAFFRVGEPVLEVIEHPPGTRAAADTNAPARFWGLAFVVEDIESSARGLGPLLGEVRDAIQPGRRIGTVRKEAGLGLPVALMSAGSRQPL